MQSPVTKEGTNNNWFDSCELFFFFETYLYYKTLSPSIISPIPQHTHNISPHISPSIVLIVDILSKITCVRFCHFITKCFNHGGAILKNRGCSIDLILMRKHPHPQMHGSQSLLTKTSASTPCPCQ